MNNDRIARMQRINDRLLEDIEREQTRPAWQRNLMMIGPFIAGMVAYPALEWVLWVIKHAWAPN
jgi:hypothetical protein